MKILILKVLIILLCCSCYYDNEQELYGEVECNIEEASFERDIRPILMNSCAVVGCHIQGGSGNGILQTYNQVKDKVDNGSFRDRVLVQRDMPPSGSLSACQIAHIDAWIKDGALDN